MGLWTLRGGRVTGNKWFSRMALVALPAPFLANSFGWIFTEMGRQPWVVVPNIGEDGIFEIKLRTMDGVSTVVGGGTVLFSMIAFTLTYGALAVVWFRLMRKDVLAGAPELPAPVDPDSPDADGTSGGDGKESAVKQLDFAY